MPAAALSLNGLALQVARLKRIRTEIATNFYQDKEIIYVKVACNLGTYRSVGCRGMHDRGSVSLQQTTDGNTVGREPWTI
jgi:hypothetical protein